MTPSGALRACERHEEMGNFTKIALQRLEEKPEYVKIKRNSEEKVWTERKKLETGLKFKVYTLQELRKEIIMQHILKLMNNMFLKIMNEGWDDGERSRRRRSSTFPLPENHMSIFSWKEGRLSSNVNTVLQHQRLSTSACSGPITAIRKQQERQ